MTRPTDLPTAAALAAVIDAPDILTADALHACRPAYNEVCVGATRTGSDEVIVMLHACRGIETSRGLRTITLARTFLTPTDAAWKVAGNSFQAVSAGPLRSRVGHATDYVRVELEAPGDLVSVKGELNPGWIRGTGDSFAACCASGSSFS